MPNTAKALRRTKTHPDMQRTDGELFRAYCNGNQKAFEELFIRHKAPLYSFCLRMIGEKDRANDAFQDTFFRAIKYRNSYNPDKEFFVVAVCNRKERVPDDIERGENVF